MQIKLNPMNYHKNLPLVLGTILLLCHSGLSQTITTMTGTAGNDTLTMQGVLTSVSESITNAYTGEIEVLNGTYNVNTDAYNGLGGNDTLLMSNTNDFLSLGLGTNRTIFSVETFIAGNGDDVVNMTDPTFVLTNNIVINGGAGNDILWGGSGNDNIQGFDGDDIICGGPGNDILDGGNGNDHFYFCTNSNDIITGDSGFDEVVFPAGITLSNLTVVLNFVFPQTTNVSSGVTNIITGYASYLVTVGPNLGFFRCDSVDQFRFADGSTIILDSPPSSHVTALPPQAGPVIAISWSGQAVGGGLPPATYSIFVSTNGVNYSEWLTNTAPTNASYRGIPGQTYYFYSMGTDAFQQTEAAPTTADAQTFVPLTAPSLAPIADAVINPGQLLTFTNMVSSGTPVGVYQFSLDSGASGASVVSSNGVFNWTPTCDQASTSNRFTVRVTDSGQTSLADTASFSVFVKECVSPQLGRLVLEAGLTGRVPVLLVSTTPLTNLTMRLTLPGSSLVNPTLEIIAPQICTSSVQAISSNQFQLNFGTCDGQFLVGTQQVAWLNFTALTNQTSAFLGLSLDNLSGRETDGTAVANFAPQSGRVVLVGNNPLMESLPGTNSGIILNLYDHVGITNVVQSVASLSTPVAWSFWQQVVLSNLVQEIDLSSQSNKALFFRSYRMGQ
jgi:hypothetical protein